MIKKIHHIKKRVKRKYNKVKKKIADKLFWSLLALTLIVWTVFIGDNNRR